MERRPFIKRLAAMLGIGAALPVADEWLNGNTESTPMRSVVHSELDEGDPVDRLIVGQWYHIHGDSEKGVLYINNFDTGSTTTMNMFRHDGTPM